MILNLLLINTNLDLLEKLYNNTITVLKGKIIAFETSNCWFLLMDIFIDSNTSKIQLTPLRFWYCVQSVHTLMAAAYTSDKSALKINDKKNY